MSRLRTAAHVAVLFFKGLFTATAIAIPVAGVWAASSLAAYQNGPVWLAVVSGALLFPGLPLLWEGIAAFRRRRKEDPRDHILTFWDRLILRTFVVNAFFVTTFLLLFPKPVFAALTTRGDWMFEEAPSLQAVGDALLGTADRLSWLWELSHENPYDDFDEDADILPGEVGAGTGTGTGTGTGAGAGAGTGTGTDTPSDAPSTPSEPDHSWPFATSLHPLVKDFPEAHAGTLRGVGLYLAAQEPDPFQRAKAVHDYVADRVSYDAPALAAGQYPPQDAETVFQERTGVCAGYARLVRAIGRAAGLEVVYVVGDARVGDQTEPTGEGHAWNAVRLEDQWFLMDATWAAGSVDGTVFTKRYSSDGFLAPPEIFGIRHFPEEPRWQLRNDPLTRGEFNRQPMLRARFYVHGFQLRSPDRSQVDTRSDFLAQVTSTGSHWLMVRAEPRGGGEPIDCGVHHGRDLDIRCVLPRAGTYTVRFFDSPRQYGESYFGTGSVVVNRR